MKITKIEAHQIETPRVTGHISGHLIVKVHVDDGPIGLGEASDSKCSDVAAVVRQYNELLVGRDPTRITETNEFLRTHNFESTVSNHHLVSAIDLALYDLNGKALGVPAYPSPRRQVPRQDLLLFSDLGRPRQRGLRGHCGLPSASR